MSIDIRLPKITAPTAEGQMQQMQSYMYQLVQQLNWALNAVSASSEESTDVVLETGTKSMTPEQTESTFSQIKSLIIKSADIVNAYYDTMKQRFDGQYVADSDYGKFVEETSQSIEQNSAATTSLYQNIQTLDSEVQQIIEANAWTKSGLLGYNSDSTPIYGFEVGQKTEVDGEEVFNKYARFTADGIYFYLPGVSESVAWMSGTKLYITNADITGSLNIGKYTIDTSSGIAFKWVGE